MKITAKDEATIWLEEIDSKGLLFELIAEIESYYSFWKYMRGINNENEIDTSRGKSDTED